MQDNQVSLVQQVSKDLKVLKVQRDQQDLQAPLVYKEREVLWGHLVKLVLKVHQVHQEPMERRELQGLRVNQGHQGALVSQAHLELMVNQEVLDQWVIPEHKALQD